jgi:hypothetical protein
MTFADVTPNLVRMWSSLRSRTAKAAFVALLTVCAITAVLAAAPAGPRFNLGVLRRDGLLVPFAAFDGGNWSAQWPSGDVGVPLPITLADVPRKWWGPPGPAASWTAWLSDGTTRTLKLGKPVHVPVFCDGHLAITTDYRGGPVDPGEPTVSKDGLAIAGDVKLQDVARVSVFAPETRHLIDLLTENFNKEEALAAKHFMRWTHPYDADERKAFPIELEALYRASDSTARGAWRTSYIEAVRRFPARPEDAGCGLITFARGWVTEIDGKKPIINIGARVTYCDRAEVSFMLPFGRLVLDKDVYWVFQISSWRDELYSVARTRPDGVRPVVAVAGGECPRGMVPGAAWRGRGRGGE